MICKVVDSSSKKSNSETLRKVFPSTFRQKTVPPVAGVVLRELIPISG